MKNTALKIHNATIQPGERVSLALPLPELFSCAPLYVPIKVAHGKQTAENQDGNLCLLVLAATRGNELNGTEIINRLWESSILKKVRGTLIMVPVMNVYGLINRTRYLPGGVDLDYSFPGSKTGTHAARVADLLTSTLLKQADVCIDLRTGPINHSNLSQVYVDLEDKRARSLAEAFGIPVVSRIQREEGTLHSIAQQVGKPYLFYEVGEAMRFDEEGIKAGLRGILNVMQTLGMLPKRPVRKTRTHKTFFTEKNISIRASTSGITYTKHRLGQYVKKGEVLCIIKEPFSATDDVVIRSPKEGIIVGKNNSPLVHEGEHLFQLAIFPETQHAADHLEQWKEESNEPYKPSGDV